MFYVLRPGSSEIPEQNEKISWYETWGLRGALRRLVENWCKDFGTLEDFEAEAGKPLKISQNF